jgi:hypothetical protein
MRLGIRTGLAAFASGTLAVAQQPAVFPQSPSSGQNAFKPVVIPAPGAGEPGRLPGTIAPQQPLPPSTQASPMVNPGYAQGPSDWNGQRTNNAFKLPLPENLQKIDGGAIIARRYGEITQIWSGAKLLKDLGRNGSDADEIVRMMRELRPTEWGGIGEPGRYTVEYGLTKGEPFSPTYTPKQQVSLDMKTVRAEQLRGVWVLRDDVTIALNFGTRKAEAEQAAAVVQKYGFNRLGTIGAFNFFYAHSGSAPAAPAQAVGLITAMQEQSLQRTGIDVPGVGFVGERIVLDPKRIEIRKDRGEYSVVHGSDVIAKCGASEWAARDALKMMQDMRFTEFCRFNNEISFFLVNGQAPNRVPFSVQASRFDLEALKIRNASGGQWGLYEGNGRMVFTVPSEKEAEQLLKLLKHYRFDQVCQVGLSSRAGLKFLGKSAR